MCFVSCRDKSLGLRKSLCNIILPDKWAGKQRRYYNLDFFVKLNRIFLDMYSPFWHITYTMASNGRGVILMNGFEKQIWERGETHSTSFFHSCILLYLLVYLIQFGFTVWFQSRYSYFIPGVVIPCLLFFTDLDWFFIIR